MGGLQQISGLGRSLSRQASFCRSAGLRSQLLGRHFPLHANRHRRARWQGERIWSSSRTCWTQADRPGPFPASKSTSRPWPSSRPTASTNSFGSTSSPNWPSRRCRTDRIGHAFQQADLPVGTAGRSARPEPTGQDSAGDSLVEPAGRRVGASLRRRVCDEDDSEQPVRPGHAFPGWWRRSSSSTPRRTSARRAITSGRGLRSRAEKMAVIIQEVVGRRQDDRFYPDVSGVGRSYNFYSLPSRPIRKMAWSTWRSDWARRLWTAASRGPTRRRTRKSLRHSLRSTRLLRGTQTEFWAVNMGKPPVYDPVSEVEYMVHADLKDG